MNARDREERLGEGREQRVRGLGRRREEWEDERK